MLANTLRFVTTTLALSCLAPRVRADEPPDTARPTPGVQKRAKLVRVQLSGDDPRLKFGIFSHAEGADSATAIHTCGNRCRVTLLPGRYDIKVSGGPEHVAGESTIYVNGDSRFNFSVPTRSAKDTWLAIAISGTALLPVGLYDAFFAAYEDPCHDFCDQGRQEDNRLPPAGYVGLGMMAVGAGAAPVGWIMFARRARRNSGGRR